MSDENKKNRSGLDRLRAKLNPESTALIIIDMQRDFCCEGGSFHKRGFDIRPAQRLAKRLNIIPEGGAGGTETYYSSKNDENTRTCLPGG